jgi:hypothetical protein
MVLALLPSELRSPCGPTPFWKPTKRSWPRTVTSSGLVSDSRLTRVLTPLGLYAWNSFEPERMVDTLKLFADARSDETPVVAR